MGTRSIPSGMQFWPEAKEGSAWTPAQVVQMYEGGFAGAWEDPEAHARTVALIKSSGGQPNGAAATRLFQGSGEGKLSLLFPAVLQLYPGALPGPAQERGDCVSHSSKNAGLLTVCNEIVYGRPDEQTGIVEGAPEVSADGIRNGVLSTEYQYWWRGYNGDGWSCDVAAEVTHKYGILLRQKYDKLGIDLTNYSGSLAGKYGARRPPDEIAAEGQLHIVRTMTYPDSYEELRDLIANGYGPSSCGGEGFSGTRDENGVSSRRGGWSHAMAYAGVDDRQEMKDLYKTRGLILVQNSWGVWNSGPRKIRGTNIEIPHGSFWAKWEEVARRQVIVYSSANGWPRKKLPDYGFSYFG